MENAIRSKLLFLLQVIDVAYTTHLHVHDFHDEMLDNHMFEFNRV